MYPKSSAYERRNQIIPELFDQTDQKVLFVPDRKGEKQIHLYNPAPAWIGLRLSVGLSHSSIKKQGIMLHRARNRKFL